ncbi:hypothetical protein FB45DRAFT_1131961 [Roridomyces roridus]|uniref:Uncharacterized protein n=1 Tax=Roridomyces roridus TaxID=1738132 RepID=A0AAD7C3S9_9AGAR|nr:hypothetical protein FB45DRAFT_1131961 [Roridomyces roridus]
MSEESTKPYPWDMRYSGADPGEKHWFSEEILSKGIAIPDFAAEREKYGPEDWSEQMESSYARASLEELRSGRNSAKPTWIFPSPFIPYARGYRDEDMSWGPPPRTVRIPFSSSKLFRPGYIQLAELRMYGLSWAIRSKPDWQKKITDESILEKWRREALEQQANVPDEKKLTSNMVNYVLTELAAYSRLSDPESGIEIGPFDAIWYSDRLISAQVSQHLRGALLEIENVPDELKDWHPRSNRQVLDLVHPSLYPVLYNRTRSVQGALVQPPAIPHHTSNQSISEQFCWLPSDFSVGTDGSVKLISPYINNLHPRHTALYGLVETVISSFVPLFERVLSQVNGQEKDLLLDVTPGSGRIKPTRAHGHWPPGYGIMKWMGIAVGCIWKDGEPSPPNIARMSDREYEEFLDAAPKRFPDAYPVYTGELEREIAPYSLRDKNIQCIIKFANIHLTVEDGEYKGGSWHVEGMVNEQIVASGIYYYDEDNITESQLSFRVTTAPPTYHGQDDELCMQLLYGMKRFHRVSPFRLLDPTKPGHRKIMAIFLVDPSIQPIPSATNVPPQQAEWVFEALEEARADPASLVSRLPPELTELIFEHACDGEEFLLRKEDAEEYRLTLMEERTVYTEHNGTDPEFAWNMCEH